MKESTVRCSVFIRFGVEEDTGEEGFLKLEKGTLVRRGCPTSKEMVRG